MTNAVVVEGLVKRFGENTALGGVDLTVSEGTVLGLLGPNGAGKTTVVRILSTLLQPDAGRAEVAGLDVLTQADQVRASIGLTGQYAAVDEYLTGSENLEMVGRLYRLGKRESRLRAGALLERFELTDAAHRPAQTYSGGMRRRLDTPPRGARPPARHRRLADRPAAGAVPRRADDRARPTQPAGHVGVHRRPGAGRDDDPAHHPVPRGGRPAGRPDGRHRQGPGDRPRHR